MTALPKAVTANFKSDESSTDKNMECDWLGCYHAGCDLDSLLTS